MGIVERKKQSALSSTQLSIRIAIIIGVTELLIMLALERIDSDLLFRYQAVFDTAALVILTTPLLIIWVIRPFIDDRDKALLDVAHMAYHDPLTKLPNRRLLTEHIERSLAGNSRHNKFGCLIYIDLNGFKSINDTHGHAMGDAVLITVAARLLENTRDEDVLSRVGGDEFIVLAQDLGFNAIQAYERANCIAEKLRDNLCGKIDICNTALEIRASFGVRVLEPDREELDTVLTDADYAMYIAKRKGHNQIAVYSKASRMPRASCA